MGLDLDEHGPGQQGWGGGGEWGVRWEWTSNATKTLGSRNTETTIYILNCVDLILSPILTLVWRP